MVKEFVQGKYYQNIDTASGLMGAIFKCKEVYPNEGATLDNGYREGFVRETDFHNYIPYQEFTEAQKEGLVEVTYKDVVDHYFGIDLKVGDNEPKLSKQLHKAGKGVSSDELVAFGELKGLLDLYGGSLWFDSHNHDLPNKFEEDYQGLYLGSWAFRDSCHRPYGAGANSAEYFKAYDHKINTLYLKAFHRKGDTFIPAYRAYVYEENGDYGHAGGYCSLDGKNLYNVTSLFIGHLLTDKLILSDWVDSEGLDMIHSESNVWANIAIESYYSKYITKVFHDEGEDWLYHKCLDYFDGLVYCINSDSYELLVDTVYSEYHDDYFSRYYNKSLVYCKHVDGYFYDMDDLISELGISEEFYD